MLTIKGCRKVRMELTIEKVSRSGKVVTVKQRILVENELVKESTHHAMISDTIAQEYKMDMEGVPLMHTDLRAMVRGEKP